MLYATLATAFLIFTSAVGLCQPVVHRPPQGSHIGEHWFSHGHLYIQLDESATRCKIVTPDDQPDTIGDCIQPNESPT